MAKIEVDVREQFGLIKELSGRVSVTSAIDGLREDVGRVQTVNIHQSREIGQIMGVLESIQSAMAKSSDKGLAEAAKGITINTFTGDSATVAQGHHVAQK